VVRKFLFLSSQAHLELIKMNQNNPLAETIEFDDMESFEHTKCKPLSIALVVESKTRKILGFNVSQMPAKGKLAAISVKKYGPRADHRSRATEQLFLKLTPFIHPQALIKSDQNPHYINDIKTHFPQATHDAYKGQRGSIVGQGELKKIRFDPLFSLNHTAAMLRANINRLFRRTWCTTKKPECLSNHIAIYAIYHNSFLNSGP